MLSVGNFKNQTDGLLQHGWVNHHHLSSSDADAFDNDDYQVSVNNSEITELSLHAYLMVSKGSCTRQ